MIKFFNVASKGLQYCNGLYKPSSSLHLFTFIFLNATLSLTDNKTLNCRISVLAMSMSRNKIRCWETVLEPVLRHYIIILLTKTTKNLYGFTVLCWVWNWKPPECERDALCEGPFLIPKMNLKNFKNCDRSSCVLQEGRKIYTDRQRTNTFLQQVTKHILSSKSHTSCSTTD